MTEAAKPHVLVLGCNFAGLTTARLLRKYAGDAVRITAMDAKDYLLFVPNLPIEVFANHDPQQTLHMQFQKFLHRDDIAFIQGEALEVDLDGRRVTYRPTERVGSATHTVDYDWIVFAVGARLSYDRIEGFGEHAHALSDSYYGNRLRTYLHEGHYRGGPVVIGSARFHQGRSPHLPDWLPVAEAACEGPPVEVALSLADWLEDRGQGSAKNITVFTPAELIAEDVGESLANQLLAMMGEMGFGYENAARDVRRVTAEGVELASGKTLEAELKILFPDWAPHDFVRGLPITDDVGFVVTDLSMRHPERREVFAVGDCASLTVPKLGALGHMQAEIASKQVAHEVGRLSEEEASEVFRPQVICMGDMGGGKAFYVHSDVWYGGETAILKMGHLPYWMKLGFKEAYYHTGGRVPSWGMPMTEHLIEKL